MPPGRIYAILHPRLRPDEVGPARGAVAVGAGADQLVQAALIVLHPVEEIPLDRVLAVRRSRGGPHQPAQLPHDPLGHERARPT